MQLLVYINGLLMKTGSDTDQYLPKGMKLTN